MQLLVVQNIRSQEPAHTPLYLLAHLCLYCRLKLVQQALQILNCLGGELFTLVFPGPIAALVIAQAV